MSAQSKSFVNKVDNVEDFLEYIIDDKNDGFGFVPLIGSGMSAPSGIPAGAQYADYLFHCITKALETKEKWEPLKWHPLEKLPLRQDFTTEKLDWCRRQLNELNVNNLNNKTFITWQAIGAIPDWRTSLNFLSRFHFENGKYTLKAPDERVIDSFFNYLTKSKQPNIAHLLIARLSESLRIQTVLTTNFDNLIEMAFQKLTIPLSRFEVHQEASLPDAQFVITQTSIVKLHGSKYGLRADFSLDKQPSREEKEKFIKYFQGFYAGEDNNKKHLKNLLVMGVSGRDRRMLSLILHALENFPNFKVYWVQHEQSDVIKIEDTLNELCKHKTKLKAELRKRFFITTHQYLGIFLLDLYQQLHCTLPPSGVRFPIIWPVPPIQFEMEVSKINNGKSGDEPSTEIVKNIRKCVSGKETTANKILAYYGDVGLASSGIEAFKQLLPEYNCLWFDLSYYRNHRDFIGCIISAVAGSIGINNCIIKGIEDKDLSYHLQYYMNFPRHPQKHIILFFSGRGFIYDENDPNCEYAKWKKDFGDQFKRSLEFLGKFDLTTVVLLWDNFLDSCEIPKIKSTFLEQGEIKIPTNAQKSLEDICRFILGEEKLDNFVEAKYQFNLDQKKLHDSVEAKCRFIYSMTQFRHYIHYAGLFSEAVFPNQDPARIGKDNDEERAKIIQAWVDKLTEKYILRGSQSGFKFTYNISGIFEDLLFNKAKSNSANYMDENLAEQFFSAISGFNIQQELFSIHHSLAEWNLKLFRTCDDPIAAFESVHHRFKCIDNISNISDNMLKTGNLIKTLTAIYSTMALAKQSVLNDARIQFYVSYYEELIPQHLENKLANIMLKMEEKDQAFFGKFLTRITERYYDLFKDYFSDQTNFKQAEICQRKASGAANLLEITVEPAQNANTDADLLAIKNLHEQSVFHMGLHKYEQSEKNILDAFEHLNLNKIEFSTLNYNSGLADKAIKWCVKERRQKYLELLVKTLRRYHYLLLLRARLKKYQGQGTDAILKKMVALYVFQTEIMRFVDDHQFVQKENTYLRTNTALQLSMMGRPSEARRRLNEASGFLAYVNSNKPSVEQGIIALASLEVYLNQAKAIRIPKFDNNGPGTDNPELERAIRQKLGFVGDAIVQSNLAQFSITLHSRKAWWWIWLYEQQLEICIESTRLRKNMKYCANQSKDIYHRCKRCLRCGARFSENLRRAMNIMYDDLLRTVRFIDRVLIFIKENSLLENEKREVLVIDIIDLFELISKKRIQNAEPDIQDYVDEVFKRVNAELPHEVKVLVDQKKGRAGRIVYDDLLRTAQFIDRILILTKENSLLEDEKRMFLFVNVIDLFELISKKRIQNAEPDVQGHMDKVWKRINLELLDQVRVLAEQKKELAGRKLPELEKFIKQIQSRVEDAFLA